MIKESDFIRYFVHEHYWEFDNNCARTSIICLCKFFNVTLEDQTYVAAAGLHGAGGFGAQCGLVEGALMFIAIYAKKVGMSNEEAVDLCKKFAGEFSEKFGSLRCCELRPGGFQESDPPHKCEGLTCSAIEFEVAFIRNNIKEKG